MDPRVTTLNDRPVRAGAKYVLYWMQMNRRARSNHALEHAAAQANRLGLPLLVYEGLTYRYPYASDRLHAFLLEGVPETVRRLRARGIGYVFYLRRRESDPGDVLYRISGDAAMVVADDYPVFVAARHNANVPGRIGVRYDVVESTCVVPAALFDKKEYGAYTLRPKLRRVLPEWMRPVERVPVEHPWTGPVPAFHTEVTESNARGLAAECDIDHSVKPSICFTGGAIQAEARLRAFLESDLKRYERDRHEPSAHATSNLSPWLHFGHISALEVALAARLHASENGLPGEGFLEELIVRRELAYNHARLAADPASLDSLPQWARATLDKQRAVSREFLYTPEEFETARTHDALWNACQTELLLRGKIHGYYRMYWGKKIIEWSASPEEALETMVRLNDRYALDGRDPNGYTNILWCFGLHDRPWQERPVFGMVRTMTLGGMKRKTGVDAYLREIAWLAVQ